MVVSTNPLPDKTVFQSLLDNTVAFLQTDSKAKQAKYQSLLGRNLEGFVADVMTDTAKGTPFENSIELIGGQRFPDIIAKRYYGVEVKTTTQNHWTTTGNSIMEGTRVEGIERIFMLFGKMVSPYDFKCRPYEDCLSEVVVTHSPRYLIDMDLAAGQTIFDKLKIPYDKLRLLPNPVKPIIDYYRQFLKAGEEVWWLEQEESKATSLIIKSWNNLPIEQRGEFVKLAMIYFPEIFSNSQDKFNGVATWLINMHGVICPNVRDAFTAGGQGQLVWRKRTYSGIPKVIVKMASLLDEIKATLDNSTPETLNHYWNKRITNKVLDWIELVAENTKYMRLSIDLKKYLKDKMIISKQQKTN